MAPFVRAGLEQGQKVLYLADNHPPDTVLHYLRDDGLDVEPWLARGQLAILPAAEVYAPQGRFDAGRAIARLVAEIDRAVDEGYSALRLTGEMTWALQALPGAEALTEYEARVNNLLPFRRCLAICQYDQRRFGSELLLHVLHTHPLVVVGTEVHDNFYYLAPGELLGNDVSGAMLRRRLRYLAEHKQVRDELDAHRQHLESLVRERTAEVRRLGGQLREKEAYLTAMLENVDDFISSRDRDGRLVMFNAPMARIIETLFGVPARPGLRTMDHLPPAARAHWDEVLARVLAGARHREEFDHDVSGQGRRVYEITFSPIVRGEEIIGTVELTRDVTEQHRAEAVLRDSEQRYRLLAENVGDMISRHDPAGVYLYVSPACRRLLGYEPDELVGRDCYELFHPDDVLLIRQSHAQILERPATGLVSFRMRRRAGDYLWVETTSRAVLDPATGQVTEIMAITRDVSERMAAEEALRRRAQELEVLRQVGLEIASRLDLDTLLQTIAAFAVELLHGADGGLFLHRPDLDLLEWSVALGDSAIPLGARLRRGEGLAGQVWARGRPLTVSDYDRWTGRAASLTGVGLRSVVAAPIICESAFLGVLQVNGGPDRCFEIDDADLLTLLATQAAIALRNARLFDAVQHQGEQLRILAGRLAETEEAERQRLARELHDQVGQNLTALGISLNILRAQLGPDISPPVAARLDDSLLLIEDTTERIRGVMADLRPPVLDDYGLAAALRWYGERLAARTGLAVHVQGDPDLALPGRVENTLFRLAQEALTNVAKHAQARQVEVTVGLENGLVRLRISDDGVGFAGDPAAGSAGQGWGLRIMAERAESLGGRCSVESAPGRGTRVTVEVPR